MTVSGIVPDARLASLDPDAFDLAAAAFESARRASADVVETRYYRVAGRTVRVRIAGPLLAAALGEPCGHLIAARDEEPALSIDVWHEAETGIAPPGRAPDPDLGLYGYMLASEDFRFVAEQRRHSLQWFDRRTHRAIVWISALNRLCLDERARPFHRLLALRFADFGIQFVHAGLVAWDEGGVLFIGKGGSGKSTCSISCVLDGATYLGDDFIGLEAARDGSFSGHSLYGKAVINPAHMTLYPALAAACVRGNYPEEEKSVVELESLAPGRSRTNATIRAIVLPRVTTGNRSVFRRISAGEALLALAPTSILHQHSARRADMERLGALVGCVPSYCLELGGDPSQIPVRAKEILAEV